MYLIRPLQKLFRAKVYPGYTDQVFAWESATGAIADDDDNSQGQGGVAAAAAVAGKDETPNRNERGGPSPALVAVKEDVVDVEKPTAAMDAETSDPDIDSSDDENSM